MEKRLLIDNNHKRNDPIIASKTVGSFVKIDSISIDLPDANDKSGSHAGNCEHFTIRGYVAEVHKKNWKLCCPFPLDGELDKFDQEPTSLLPPLDPPKFRRWSCQNCVLETGSVSIARDHGTDIRIGSDSNNKCAQVPHHSDAPLLLLDSEQGSISKTVDGKRVEAHVSVDGIGNEQHPLSSPFDKKEGRHEVAPTAITVNKNVLDDYASHEMPRLNSAEAEVDPKRTQERHKAEAVNLEGNGSVEVWKSGCESHDDTNIKLHFSNNKSFWNKNLIQTSEAERRPSAEENHKESINASGTCKIVGTVDRAGDATKGQTNINHPLHECDYASSENLDKSSSLNRKKGRKVVRVRLLSELGDAKPDCFRTEDSPSNRISNTSGAGTISQGQVSVQESARVDLGENNKRKLPEEEEQRSQGTSLPKSLNRKVKTSKRDEETTRRVEDSELEEDAVARISLQADMRSNCNRSEIEQIPAVGKKKIMKSNYIGVCSSLVPPKDIVPIEVLDKVGSSSKGNATTIASSIPAYDASTVREIDQIALPAPKAGRKSGSCKRKDKMPEVDNGLASLFPWLTKGPNTRKDAEFMQTGHPFHRAEDSPAEKGLDLSLNSYLSAQRDDRTSIPQSEDGFPSWSTRKDGTGKLDEFIRKNAEANANLNRLPKPVSNAFSGKIGHDDRSSKFFTYSMPIPNEKQNYRSQVEGSLLQQMDTSHARNKEKIIEVPKNSAVPVSRKDSNHRAEKMSHKGAADDIPMEIVEFMAKNHYERNQKVLEAGINSRNVQVMDHSYGFGNLRILEETGQKRKPQARKAKDGATARKNMGPSKQKLVDFSTYIPEKDTFRFDQMHCPTGFNAFSQPKKKMSTREQFPASGYSSCSCAQNCKWNGDMMSHGLSNSSLRPSVPQSKEEAARLWSPAMPSQTPLTHYNPQKCAAQPSNVDMLSHPPGSLHKGNFHGDYGLKLFNLNATNLEKHSEGVGSEPFSRTNAEYSFTGKRNGTEPPKSSAGSFDLYSNETIPAMHLLSLMDAGMRSSPPFSIAGNPKFPKRPIDFYSKEYSAVDAGGYKVTDTMKHPSSSCFGKNHISEKSLDLFPINPGGTSTSSYPKEFTRAAVENRGSGSQNSAFKGGVLGKNHGTIPVMHKGLATLADSTMFPQHHHNTEYPMLQKLDTHNANGAMRPPRSSPNSLICTINKNPAEFSLPEDGNEYMISGKDLKVGKQRHSFVQVDQNKQPKKRKQTTGKGHAQQ